VIIIRGFEYTLHSGFWAMMFTYIIILAYRMYRAHTHIYDLTLRHWYGHLVNQPHDQSSISLEMMTVIRGFAALLDSCYSWILNLFWLNGYIIRSRRPNKCQWLFRWSISLRNVMISSRLFYRTFLSSLGFLATFLGVIEGLNTSVCLMWGLGEVFL
jgi:hypothetical protein